MANPEHVAILKHGATRFNEWREQNPAIIPQLDQLPLGTSHRDPAWSNLRRQTMYGSRSEKLSLVGVNLARASLRHADLSQVNLCGADLSSADLSFAILKGTALKGARLCGTSLAWATLIHVNLDGADFNDATIGGTVLGDLDLSTATGLDRVVHMAPSTLGVDSLERSHGQIPEEFMRGVGLADTYITYACSLGTQPIRFSSCFISHSTKDRPFVDRLYADLQSSGVRCWFAPHDASGGRKLYEQIDEAIHVYDRLLLILSNASMNSDWVKAEVANARQREVREKRQMLFPVTLVPYQRIKGWRYFDADTGKDTAREIREYYIPDFSNWKDHDSYQQAFQRLLRDLKAEPKPQASV